MQYHHVSPVPPLTRVTKVLIIICVTAYLVEFFLRHLPLFPAFPNFSIISYIFGLVPILVVDRFWIWQPVTYIFLHGNLLHILLNMLILWYFGAEIELRMGSKEFLKFFLFCGVGAGLFNLGVNLLFSSPEQLQVPIIGASGAIFGILAAYGIFFANRYFLVFFVFPMKAKYFVLLMAAIELIMGVEAKSSDNVAHFAHLGGLFVGGGYVYFRYVKGWTLARGGRHKRDLEKERLKKQFTLIINDAESEEDPQGKGPYWN